MLCGKSIFLRDAVLGLGLEQPTLGWIRHGDVSAVAGSNV